MSVRSVAMRRAAQVRSERAARFAVREAAIAELAVGFFEATGLAEDVIDVARRRCEQIMATAAATARQSLAEAATALAELTGMGVPRAEIAEITGLTAREVRDLLTADGEPNSSSEGQRRTDDTSSRHQGQERATGGVVRQGTNRVASKSDQPDSHGRGEPGVAAGQLADDPASATSPVAAGGPEAEAGTIDVTGFDAVGQQSGDTAHTSPAALS
jgi:predicted transcriptional regulator